MPTNLILSEQSASIKLGDDQSQETALLLPEALEPSTTLSEMSEFWETFKVLKHFP